MGPEGLGPRCRQKNESEEILINFQSNQTALRRTRKFLFRSIAKLLTIALSTSLLAIVVAQPAQAYTTCGNVLGASASSQSYTNSGAKLTITPKHGTIFYLDSRRGINASYVAYSITNNEASATKKNLWVKVSGFTAASGSSLISLANPADNSQQIASLAAGTSATVYFLLTANKSAAIAHTHTVEVFTGDPRLSTTPAATAGCDYTFTRIDQTIAANANKVNSVSVSTTTPVLGGTVVVTVQGATGTAGSGDAAGDKDVMWISPASVASWPTRSLRLESTQIQIKRLGKVVSDTFNDSLIIMQINKNGSNFTSKTLYTSTYTFRVIGGASANPTVKPVAQIASGTQMKHTGSYGTLPVINLTSLATPMTVSKTAAAAAYTPTSCNATTKIAVRYTITARLAAGTAGTATLDEVVDVPPSGSVFDTQSSQATYSDATPVTNASLGTPSTITGESPTKLHWTGPFYVTSTTPATFSYTMCVDKVAGTYQNTAYGYVGNTIVGSNSLQVSCVIATTNGTTFTLSTSCNTTKPKQPQTITFGALDPVGVSSVTQLYATSSSGLPVVFSTSSSSSICTVSYNATTGSYEVTAVSSDTCVINANQAGDTTYDPATQVSQNLTIKAGQYISVSSTTSMLINSTQNFTATSLKRSDNTNTGLAVTMTSLTPDLCTVAVVTAAPNFRVTSLTTTGLCSLMASQAGDATYGAATEVYVDIYIGSLQTINFTNPENQTSITSPSSPITVSATSVDSTTLSNTNLQVTFSSLTPDICDISTSGGGSYVSPTISGGVSSTTVVKFTAGVCTLIASQDGTTTGAGGTQSAYSPATDAQVTFTIGQPQVITFNKPSDVRLSAGTRSISASTTSSLLITFTSTTTGICTVASGSLSGATTTATVTLRAGGTCVITASQPGDGSWYAAASVTQTFIVTGATNQTISFSQGDVNINTSPITLSATASSGLPVTFTSTTGSVCTVSEVFVTLYTVGNCTIVASQSGDVTYAAANDFPATFVVFAKPIITFTQSDVVASSFPQNQTLSSSNQYQAAAGLTATGLTNTYTSSTTSVCDITSGSNLSLKTVGTCTVVASQSGSSPNFLASDSVTVSFLVTSGQSITFGALTAKTYGDANFDLSATASSGLTVTFSLTTGAGICSLTGTTVTILAAGSCSFTASQAGDANYSAATPVVQPLTINKKALTFTATAANKVYNGSDTASLTSSALTGVINSDDVSINTGQVTGRFNTPDVGDNKPVTVTLGASVLSGTKAGNYSVTLTNSPTANITTKAITMTVGISNKVYDGVDVATISSSSLTGVESGDNVNIDGTKISALFNSADKGDGKAVTVTLATGVLTGTDSTNYTVTVAGSPSANITARPITVTADNKTKGSGAADPTFTYSITSGSLVSRGGQMGSFTGTLARDAGTTAGTYPIRQGDLAIVDGVGGSASNYTLTFVNGSLTITDKTIPQICWSNPARITYGTALSATQLDAEARVTCGSGSALPGTFTYSPLSGAVLLPGTQTLSVTFAPTDGTTYASASGTVSIIVDPKAITVTAVAKTKTYGSSDPALTFTTAAGALVGSDTLAGLLVRATGENAGTYAINQGTVTTANNPNYTITYTGANLTIERKAITITADATSKTYGGSDPTLTYQVTTGSLVPGETLTGVLARAAGDTFGTYAINQNTITNANNANYDITYVGNNFSVNKKPITMTVGVSTKEYNGTLAAIISSTSLNDVEAGDTVTIDGTKVTGAFANPDQGVGKTVTITLAAGVLTGTHANNYSVTVAGSPLANITTRAVTVVADNKTKSQTAADPTFTYSITVGSLVSRLTVADTFTGALTRANLGTNTPGTYAITAGTLALSANYTLTITPGTLTITDKIIPVICWSAPVAITYGTELSATQLNATAREACGSGSDLPGTFTYSPASGTVLIAGTHTLSVTFGPTDSVTYATATGTVSITVNPKALTVTADDKSGTTTAAATFTVSSGAGQLVGSDAVSGATFSFSGGGYGPSGTSPTVAGTFVITPSNATFSSGSASNYLITYAPGTYTVTSAGGGGGPAGPAPSTPAPTVAKPATPAPTPVVISKTLPVKKVTLTSKTTAAAPVVLGMIVSTTGSSNNQSSLASVPTTLTKAAVVIGATTPAPSTPGNSNSQSPSVGNGNTTPASPSTPSSTPNFETNTPETTNGANNGSSGGGNSGGNSAGSGNGQASNSGRANNVEAPSQQPDVPQVIQVIENRPAFVSELTSKIAVSLSMEESKTQVRDERAIVQLNTNTGQIRVQALNGWTGVLKVPTYMATDEAIIEIENVVTVNPDPTPQFLVRPTAITRTALGWAKSPTTSVQKYEVRVNGELVCETAATTCVVKRLIGPKTKVNVTAIGNEGTRSDVQVGKYSPSKRVKVFTINFDEEKWDFTPTAIKKLNTYIDIIRREGFTQAFVLGYTDSQGSPSTSVPLSRKRATVTTKYLKDRLPEILFKWFAFGEADPLRKGLDPEDFAANRRAEIYVK